MGKLTELPEILALQGSDEIVITDSSASDLTTRAALDTLVTYLEANLDLGTTIDGLSDVPGLVTALAAKSDVGHTHPISDIVGLQTTLDAKYDSTSAGIVNNTVIIGPNSVDVIGIVNEAVADITGVTPTDTRIPNNVTAGNRLVFTSSDGSIGEETPQQFKSDLELNNVDNTTDVDKPISSATQDALDLKQNASTAFDGDYNNLSNSPTTITDAQAMAIIENTAKRSYPQGDETKLSGIEAGADITDSANVYSALGISNSGAVNRVLSERGVYVNLASTQGTFVSPNPPLDADLENLYSVTIGEENFRIGSVLVDSVTANVTMASGAAETLHFTVTGVPGTVVNFSIVNAMADWVQTSDLTLQQGTIGEDGTIITSITLPILSNVSSRTFQVQAQVEGAFQSPVLSDTITQEHLGNIATVVLDNVTFMSTMEVANVTVTGDVGSVFDFSITADPVGWLTTGALGAASGTIPADGSFETTISIPLATGTEMFQRTLVLRATLQGDAENFAESATVTQTHSPGGGDGDLMVSTFVTDYFTPNLYFYVTVSAGDVPIEVVINEHPTDSTDNPLFDNTITDDTGIGQFMSFGPLDTSSLPDGDRTYYLHTSDSDGDVVVSDSTVSIVNQQPSGSISLSQGSVSPMDGDTVEFTSSFSDAEGDSFTYQWQSGSFVAKADWDFGTAVTDTFFNAPSYIVLSSRLLVWVSQNATNNLESTISIFANGADHSVDTPLLTVDSTSVGSTSGTANRRVTLTQEQVDAIDSVLQDTSASNNVEVLSAANIRIEEESYDYSDLTGETNSSYTFTSMGPSGTLIVNTDLSDVSAKGSYDHTAVSAAASNFPNSGVDGSSAILTSQTNTSNGSQAIWGVDTSSSSSEWGILAIWAEGVDHSELPSYTFTDQQTGSTDAFGVGFIHIDGSIGSDITQQEIIDIQGSGGTYEDTTRNGDTSTEYYGFPAGQVELWSDLTSPDLPTIDVLIGATAYRVVVTAGTGNTTPIASNIIELV